MLRAILRVLARTQSAVPGAADTWDDGVAAYNRGDYETAVRLLRPLAEQGDARAQLHLGTMYFLGNGVPQDYAEAEKWYRKAAEQGDAAAQYNLGLMYYEGNGVPLDYILVHMWLNLAAAQGMDAKKPRDALAKRMTSEQIAEAQKLAREWKPKE
jgi:TPR repeat protein